MNMNNWIDHLHHPLVFAGFGLFLFALIIKPLFLNNKKLPGTAIERLLRRAMILLFLLAAMAIAGGIALNWKATPEAMPEKVGSPNLGLQMQQYEERLKKVEQQLLAKQASGTVTDEQERRLLEAQLKGVQEKLANLQQSYKEKTQLLQETYAELKQFKGRLPEARLAKAEENILKGDTEAAEQVFDEVVDKEGESVALAAYQSGQLAEGRLDYTKAMQRYTKAVALEEDNPDYLLAAGKMACTLTDYDRAQEWLTKMPNDMSDDQISDFVDLAVQLLHDTGRYREMGIIITINLGLRALQEKIDWKLV